MIDADALMKRIEDSGRNAGFSQEAYCKIKRFVATTHTIEAEPVRHAKVLYNVAIKKEECNGYKKRNGLVLQKYTCSSCYTAIDGDSKFCKECGAKLNLED